MTTQLTRQHILIVDDEAMIRDLLGEFLSGKGYRVSSACRPDEAIRAMNEDRADLVISDVQLEQEDGLSLVRTLRERDPSLPIMILTGVLLGNDFATGTVPDNLAGYISKTSSLGEILREIKRLLPPVNNM